VGGLACEGVGEREGCGEGLWVGGTLFGWGGGGGGGGGCLAK